MNGQQLRQFLIVEKVLEPNGEPYEQYRKNGAFLLAISYLPRPRKTVSVTLVTFKGLKLIEERLLKSGQRVNRGWNI